VLSTSGGQPRISDHHQHLGHIHDSTRTVQAVLRGQDLGPML
jgi:hypothetical protein